MTETPFLSLRGIGKTYALGRSHFGGPQRFLHAVDDVTLDVRRGETLGLVGESGCGKSSLARVIMQLERPTAGTMAMDGIDPTQLGRRALKDARRNFQMIFQDPYASLNPRMKVRAIIAEVLRNYRTGSEDEIAARVEELAGQVGLGRHLLDRFPHELSGGQCQRIGIARAIALKPRLIVADEPVSALDVSIQAQILNLIVRLQAEMGLTLVFVSHDMSVVSHVADRVAVMYLGRIVEMGETDAIFNAPSHPYTRTLLAAVPSPTPAARTGALSLKGELPSPLNPPSGCHFRTRCPYATDRCAAERPMLRPIQGGRQVACHFAEAFPTNPTKSFETVHA
ncbi:ABC transporter ATP-binding protein [Youhaiella tibetensis]|uniref:ATP-binding cassette domain-containing protein n=1 Tax=Paradevosia tibetensis TaxID=1447062 RepID=A0A5B9DLM7_9HYPH|nr:oligopeptide/dipeptide ABC transporter ATP-binding protein [Youhaiella tibetensis]QEE20160.1 ATP-binding cassette domain-containing protein [Youhaiella tibetensis]GGF26605.1 ABC transporter ATP-binding protein [Youhaiella tibetensis]